MRILCQVETATAVLTAPKLGALAVVRLPINCEKVSEIRHQPRALTVYQRHAGGASISRHRHDDHQLVYVSTGVLAVETAAGRWVASKDRAVWLPGGTWHAHRFYGASEFHTVGFPRAKPPLG